MKKQLKEWGIETVKKIADCRIKDICEISEIMNDEYQYTELEACLKLEQILSKKSDEEEYKIIKYFKHTLQLYTN